MIWRIKPVGFGALLLATCQLLAGQQREVTPSGGLVMRVDGLDFEFDAAGQWTKVYSTYIHPVEFPDRRGIKKAQIIAEEKGKAAIVRYLNQEVQTGRIVDEIDSASSDTKMTKRTGAQDNAVKTNERKMSESVREFTRSYASGNLKGVVVLETGYDEKKEEAWVKVGFSRTTMQIADELRGAMEPNHGGAPAGPGGTVINAQPSEVRSRKLP